MLDELARFQMCAKVVVDFPDSWRKNVIEAKREVRKFDLADQHRRWDARQLDLPVWIRAEHAFGEITERFTASSLMEEDVLTALQALAGDLAVNLIVEACLKHQVTPDEILEAAQTQEPAWERDYELGFLQ